MNTRQRDSMTKEIRKMATPYNLEIHNDCTHCPLREDGRFCNLSDGALSALNGVNPLTIT